MTELQLGKYEFYPYEFDAERAPTLDQLLEMLGKAKARTGKDAETPSRSIGQRRPRRKRRG